MKYTVLEVKKYFLAVKYNIFKLFVYKIENHDIIYAVTILI